MIMSAEICAFCHRDRRVGSDVCLFFVLQLVGSGESQIGFILSDQTV